MSSNKGLGRGLDALFGGSAPKQEPQGQESAVNLMPITALHPNPNQPRRHFDDAALRELADSIKSQGIIQPLLVRRIQCHIVFSIEPEAFEGQARRGHVAALAIGRRPLGVGERHGARHRVAPQPERPPGGGAEQQRWLRHRPQQ